MTRVGSFLARAGAAAGIAIGTALGAASAHADCFEGIGCTDSDYFDVDDLVQLSCANLWHVRNRVYDENGYCFKTRIAKRRFDNSDCWIESQSQVKMSTVERHNVNAIVAAERENGCD